MLAYILALAVALGSFGIYMAAFFFPEIHRKNDFIWSGVGMFYALVLWICAGRITGGVLLGQIASVVLLGWFGWQTVTLRYALTPAAQRTDVPSQEELKQKIASLSIPERANKIFSTVKEQIQPILTKVTQRQAKPEVKQPQPPSTTQVIKDTQTIATEEKIDSPAETPVPELIPPNPPSPELVEAASVTVAETTITEPIEAIAPEVELAPPAEPIGAGDPIDRQLISEEKQNPSDHS